MTFDVGAERAKGSWDTRLTAAWDEIDRLKAELEGMYTPEVYAQAEQQRDEALALLRKARDDGQLDFDADGWARVDALLEQETDTS